jgi:hypothetical protein
MSKVAVRSLSGSCTSDAASLAKVAPRLLTLSVEAVTDLLQGMAGLLGPVLAGGPGRCMPAMPTMARPSSPGCCEIPEVDCPPRCVCEITWEAARGEKLQCSIRVVNSSASARTFHLSSTAFAGPAGGGKAAIDLAPTSLQLAGGMSGVVEASFAVPDEMAPGAYEAEILVRGAYEQCVRVLLCVTRKPGCGPDLPQCCRCEITQGDPPIRIRAHHWYDHFQCSEPCVTPTRKVDNPDQGDHG